MSVYNDITGALQSYLASALGFMQEVNWMAVGATVLLVARLIQDVPKAIEEINRIRNKRKIKHDQSD